MARSAREAITDLGGDVPTEVVRADLRERVELFRKHAKLEIDNVRRQGTRRLPTIEFALLDSSEINAFIGVAENSEYYICFTLGAVYLIEDFFRRVCTVSSFLPDGADEVTQHLERLVPTVYLLAEQGVAPAEPPRDPNRAHLAELLAEHAMCFLLLHELAHARHGHLEYVRTLGMTEIRERENAPDAVALRHALEMDADAAATAWTVTRVVTRSRGTPGQDRQDVEAELMMWWYGVYGLFRLCAAGANAIDFSRSHPPPRLRQRMIFQIVGPQWPKWSGLNKPIEDVLGAAMLHLEATVEAFTSDRSARAEVAFTGSETARQHIGRILAAYAEIHEQLEHLAFCNTLAKPQPRWAGI